MWRSSGSRKTRDIARRLIWFLALWVAGVAVVGAAAFILRGILL